MKEVIEVASGRENPGAKPENADPKRDNKTNAKINQKKTSENFCHPPPPE